MINIVTLVELDKDTKLAMFEGIQGVDEIIDGYQTMSFASKPPNVHSSYNRYKK